MSVEKQALRLLAATSCAPSVNPVEHVACVLETVRRAQDAYARLEENGGQQARGTSLLQHVLDQAQIDTAGREYKRKFWI